MMKNFNRGPVDVQVGNVVRKVTVQPKGKYYSTGYVGKAVYWWHSDKYDVPYVKLNGRTADRRTSLLVKKFLLAYKDMLLKRPRTPMHFAQSNAAAVDARFSDKKLPTSISGIPLWMSKDCKEWTECKKKDGSVYLRRTRFKEESRETVEMFLPFCTQCQYRASCTSKCSDPDLMCKSEILVDANLQLALNAEEVVDALA